MTTPMTGYDEKYDEGGYLGFGEVVDGDFYKASEVDAHLATLQAELGGVRREVVSANTACDLEVNVRKVLLEQMKSLVAERDTLKQQLAEVTEKCDGWRKQYEACHVLHLEAQAECEEKNTFVMRLRAITAEQQLAAREEEIGKLKVRLVVLEQGDILKKLAEND